jgi:hypothetical protein
MITEARWVGGQGACRRGRSRDRAPGRQAEGLTTPQPPAMRARAPSGCDTSAPETMRPVGSRLRSKPPGRPSRGYPWIEGSGGVPCPGRPASRSRPSFGTSFAPFSPGGAHRRGGLPPRVLRGNGGKSDGRFRRDHEARGVMFRPATSFGMGGDPPVGHESPFATARPQAARSPVSAIRNPARV